MTPIARAEKICSLIIHNWKPDGDDERIKAIATKIEEAILEYTKAQPTMSLFLHKKLIEEAEREAVKNAEHTEQWWKEAYAEGFRAAQDKAKGIAEAMIMDSKIIGDDPFGGNVRNDTAKWLSQRIKEMKI